MSCRETYPFGPLSGLQENVTELTPAAIAGGHYLQGSDALGMSRKTKSNSRSILAC